MSVDQLDRITGLSACILLRQTDGLFIGRIRKYHIVAQRMEKCICHREKFMDHQYKRNTDRFLLRVTFTGISVQKQSSRLMIKFDIFPHSLTRCIHVDLFSGKIKSNEAAFFVFYRILGKQSHAICTTDREKWIDRNPFAVKSTESRHNARIICNTSL